MALARDSKNCVVGTRILSIRNPRVSSIDQERGPQDGSRSDDDSVLTFSATLIDGSVDNSEHTRNGDFTPTRFGAQADAVNMIFTAKTQSNPESTAGVMTLAGTMLSTTLETCLQ